MLGRVHAGATGCGIAIRGPDLVAVAVRVQRGGISVLGRVRIPDFAERPPEEWGAEYQGFLRACGLKKPNATVCIPREEVVWRSLDLPPMPDRELESTVKWQVPDLHPFGEDAVVHDWVLLQDQGSDSARRRIASVIARNATITAYEERFTAAGIPLSGCTIAAAALDAATSLHATLPSRPILVADIEGSSLELYGRSEGIRVWSAVIDLGGVTLEGALRLALEGLAASEEVPAKVAFAGAGIPSHPETGLSDIPLSDILPEPVRVAGDFDLRRDAVAYATAVASTRPRSGLRLNLLPARRWQPKSLRPFALTAALGGALALVVGAHLARGALQDRNYLEKLRDETARLEADADTFAPDINEAAGLGAQLDWLLHRRNRAAHDLITLREISQILPTSAWLTGLALDDSSAVLAGVAANADPLLEIINASSSLAAPRFSATPARGERGESFQIEATRR